MITRDFATVYGSDLNGIILCGTAGYLKYLNTIADEIDVLIADGKGKDTSANFLASVFGSFVERFGPNATPNDWIANDPNVVADHSADPFNNLTNPPSIESLSCLTGLWRDISKIEWAKKVPNMPIYIIAGDQDPVGNYGEGIYNVANMLATTGKNNVTTKLYSWYRHEIHNELPIRDEVEKGIIEFLDSNL